VWYDETGAEAPVVVVVEEEEDGAGLRRSAPEAARDSILCELIMPELILTL